MHDAVYSGTRTVLNLAEALKKCNEDDWSAVVAGTKWTGVECQAYTFGSDTLESMAVAQQADMFLSLHGSGGGWAQESPCCSS